MHTMQCILLAVNRNIQVVGFLKIIWSYKRCNYYKTDYWTVPGHGVNASKNCGWLLTLLSPLSQWVWPLLQGVWSQGVLILVASLSLNRTLPSSVSNWMSCQTSTHLTREKVISITDLMAKNCIHTFSWAFAYVYSTLWNDVTLSSLYWHLYRS